MSKQLIVSEIISNQSRSEGLILDTQRIPLGCPPHYVVFSIIPSLSHLEVPISCI
jgi:hypothetical protein